MHSRIYQISKRPINEENYLTEACYTDCDSFFDGMAKSDRSEDIEWLGEKAGMTLGEDKGGRYVIINKHKYFHQKFIEFRRYAEELLRLDFDSFCSWKGETPMYRVKTSYEDTQGFHVYFCNEPYNKYSGTDYSMDEFVRTLPEGDTKFYIGGTLDYHF